MKPNRLLQTAIYPALLELDGMGIPTSPKAARFLLAIAIQESGLANRRQVGQGGAETGPAVSYWQGEVTGGMILVLKHAATKVRMADLCAAYNVGATPQALWEAIRYQDIVAAAAARLLVFTLPGALPVTEDDGWQQYLSAWRPGRPHRERWGPAWKLATETVGVV